MKTLVVKIGTSTLVRDGRIDEQYIAGVARQVVELRAMWRVVIVSSGAVRAGLDAIGKARATKLPEKQAAAAIGQSLLMRAYRRAFEAHGMPVAQMLLTRSDIADRRRFLNARRTAAQLFSWGVVPIVNENDTVATEEIRFGDNDTLASLTALVVEADRVLLLSDVKGFYLPGQSEPLAQIPAITPEIEAAAGGAGSIGGTGGMRTKIEAARIATQAGIELVIAQGRERDVIQRVAQDDNLGTRFLSSQSLRGRKRWIAFGTQPAGTLTLHPRARPALEGGASLLAVGVLEVAGEFPAGALVALRDTDGEFGRGLCNVASESLRHIAGLKSAEAFKLLGDEAPTAVIHRDNLTLASR